MKKKLPIKSCPLKTRKRPHQNYQKILGGIFIPIIILGWFYPLIGLSILACMLAGILIAIKKGRKWCDWYCPRGSFLDEFITRISPQKTLPKFFYNYKFRLFFITLLFSFLTFNIIRAYPNPQAIAFAFVKTLTITTILSLILGLFFRARAWCFICPVGTFSALIGKNKKPLQINFDKCLNCTNCKIVCPMGLEPYKSKKKGEFKNGDCIKCETCVANCPSKALKF